MGAARGFILSQLSLSSSIPHSLPLSIQQRFHGFNSPPPLSSSGIRHRFSSRRWLTCSLVPPPARFDGTFTTRCSLTNCDVELNDVASLDEADEEAFPSSSSCSTPLTRLKFDIPEADPLNLLSKGGYIDSVLTSLPVLSKEERSTLAATPAHPGGLYALYANCLAGNLVEQLWNFAWPAAIALIHRSILLVAVMSFFTKLAVILGGPLVGKLMDRVPRVPCYNFLSLVQALAQLLSAAMIIHGHTVPSTTISHVLIRPWFITLLLAGGVERLTGLALGIAMERDWVVLLAGTNRQIALAQANAVISRIDLLCEILGASFFGILLSKYDPVTCLKLAAGLMIWSLPVVVSLTWLTNKLSGGVLDRVKCQQASLWQSGSEITGRDIMSYMMIEGPVLVFTKQNAKMLEEQFHQLKLSVRSVDLGFDSIKHGWVEYLQQPVLPASIAYVLLHFNVVLAPGGLMTAYLVQHGLSSSVIGGFSGLCAFMGVAATFLSAALVRELGILKAGAAGLVFHALLLTLAAAMHWSGYLAHKKALLFFLCLIALSRLGHMSYDVVGSQILQTGIPPSKANLIGTTEVSIASLAEFVMLGVAIVANDVSHFGFLATLSLIAVVGAASTFCGWLLNPTDEQNKLFSFDSPVDSMGCMDPLFHLYMRSGQAETRIITNAAHWDALTHAIGEAGITPSLAVPSVLPVTVKEVH